MTKNTFSQCSVVLALLQPWSKATSHMKKNRIASAAMLFTSMVDSSEQLDSF
jgi:hypothetical protein